MVTHFIKFVFFKAKVKAKVQMEEMKGVKKKKSVTEFRQFCIHIHTKQNHVFKAAWNGIFYHCYCLFFMSTLQLYNLFYLAINLL